MRGGGIAGRREDAGDDLVAFGKAFDDLGAGAVGDAEDGVDGLRAGVGAVADETVNRAHDGAAGVWVGGRATTGAAEGREFKAVGFGEFAGALDDLGRRAAGTGREAGLCHVDAALIVGEWFERGCVGVAGNGWRWGDVGEANAESVVGETEDVGAMGDDDGDVGGHAGAEFLVVVADLDDRFVGDDVLDGDGRVANGGDASAELAVGEGVDGEVDGLADRDVANVGFGDGADDLHFGEIVGDGEEDGGVEGGGDGLADVDLAGEDDAVDRRVDGAAGEIDFGVFDRGGAGLDLRVGLGELREGLIEVGLGNEAVLLKRGGPFGVELDEAVVGFGVGEFGFGRAEAGLVGGGVDVGDDVAVFHDGVIVDQDLIDDAGDLAADFDGDNRLQRAGGSDGLGDVGAGDRGGDVFDRLGGALFEIIPACGGEGGDDDERGEESDERFRFGHESRREVRRKTVEVGKNYAAKRERAES